MLHCSRASYDVCPKAFPFAPAIVAPFWLCFIETTNNTSIDIEHVCGWQNKGTLNQQSKIKPYKRTLDPTK